MSNSINAKAAQDMFRFVLKAKGAIQSMTKEVLKEIPRRLQDRSPVGNPTLWHPPYWPKGYNPGHFMNNWQMGVDVKPTGIIEGEDPSGKLALERMHKAIPRWPVGHIYYFTNNLPYARLLETGLHSSQCPAGMVGITASEFPQIVRQVEIKYSEEH